MLICVEEMFGMMNKHEMNVELLEVEEYCFEFHCEKGHVVMLIFIFTHVFICCCWLDY